MTPLYVLGRTPANNIPQKWRQNRKLLPCHWDPGLHQESSLFVWQDLVNGGKTLSKDAQIITCFSNEDVYESNHLLQDRSESHTSMCFACWELGIGCMVGWRVQRLAGGMFMCYAWEGWRTQEIWGWQEPCRVVITMAEKSWSILWVWLSLHGDKVGVWTHLAWCSRMDN